MKTILLVGDSIRQDYGQVLDPMLPHITVLNKAGLKEAYQNLDLPMGSNVGDSSGLLAWLRKGEILLDASRLDLFAFNCGLHDVKRHRPGDQIQIPPEAYKENLTDIVTLVRSKGIPVVFINTTMADASRYAPEATFTRFNEDVLSYNEIAGQVMESLQVPVIDLYGFTASLGFAGDELFRDHTHFQPEVIRLQAAYLAGCLGTMMAQEESL